MTLGVVSGIIGTILKMGVDTFFVNKNISKLPFRVTAAGVWVNSKKQASSRNGQILGTIMDLGMGMIGAIGQVSILTKTGRDNLATKSTFFGIAYGSIVTAILSGFNVNKIKPKDATSNLAYVLSHLVYGVGVTYTASLLGDETLWDTPPKNDYLQPTQPTSAQKDLQTLTMAK